MDLNLDPQINLVVGANGAGKSSILDAISYLLSWYIARMNNPKGNGDVIPLDDIKKGEQYCFISLQTENFGKWSLSRTKPHCTQEVPKSDFSEMMEHVRALSPGLFEENVTSVPVVIHYHVNRSVTEVPLRLRRNKNSGILDTYKDALKSKLEFRQFFQWFREREDLENEYFRRGRRKDDIQLKAVRNALSIFFPLYTNLHVRRQPMAMVLKKNHESFNINQLSDGEKCYISLICDLSRRLAIANPENENPLDGNGIVLIDEIELHLHPAWQMEVIQKLKQTFKNCQFIISTHSPQIVSDIQNNQLILMNDGNRVNKGLNTYGKLVNDILVDQFGIEAARSMEVQSHIQKAKNFLLMNQDENYLLEIKWLEDKLGKGDLDILALRIEASRRNQLR